MIDNKLDWHSNDASCFEFRDILKVPLNQLVFMKKKDAKEEGRKFDEEKFRANPFGMKVKFKNNRKKQLKQ